MNGHAQLGKLGAVATAVAVTSSVLAGPVRGDGEDGGIATAWHDSDRAPLPRSVRRAADGDFAGIDGWGPLHWNMEPEAAVEALERAGIEAELVPGPTGLFDVPCPVDQPDCAAPHDFVEVTFDEVTFEYRGWQGRAEFASWQLREISLVSPRDAEEWREAAVVADLESLYGAPDRTWPPETYSGFRRTVWADTGTELTVLCGHLDDGWSTSLRYERVPRGWP